MGLEGTLRVFSLSDIFQVLGLQKKSGVLSVEGDEDSISVSFLGGQVVSAESSAKRLETRLGSLLVRAGRISEEDLQRVLEIQKETQQRLGFLLIRERLVSPEDLRDALRLQISRIVYAAFRWPDGRFRFSQDAPIDYDADHMSPVSTESVLMEAAQMLDEWPLIQKKVPSMRRVYKRAPGVENLHLVPTGSTLAGEGTLAVSKAEAEVWKWIDGRHSVQEILERAFVSDFDGYKAVGELIDRHLLVEGPAEPERIPEEEPAMREDSSREAAWAPPMRPGAARVARGGTPLLAWLILVGIAAGGALLVSRNPVNVFMKPRREARETGSFLKAVSLDRLVGIERAVRVFYDSTGRYPRSLDDLVANGILNESLVRDPWNRRYRYILRSEDGKFGLYGRNSAGEIDLDLSFDRSLAPVSDALIPTTRRAPEVIPGVQVIE
jgi:hypothetical protein